LKRACDRAAEQIGAPPRILYHVVTGWDAGNFGPDWLLDVLEGIWAERQADAEAVQSVLCPPHPPPLSPALALRARDRAFQRGRGQESCRKRCYRRSLRASASACSGFCAR